MKYLISTVETYRIDSEPEVQTAIAEAKEDSRFTLSKYNCEHKEVKAKGEIVDEFYKVTLTKIFNDIKDPYNDVTVSYEV